MRIKRSVIAVNLITLIKVYASDVDSTICVFEGHDAQYYGVRIDAILRTKNRKNLICKGKDNLIILHSKTQKHPELC